MELKYTVPQDYKGKRDKIFCDKCKKRVEVEKGIYHCAVDKEDYHK